jgi:hypothetical protein
MTSPNTKLSLAVIVATFGILCSGWASAQSLNIPAGSVCKTVRTTFEVDTKGRTIITVKKVCEVAK